MMVLLDDSVLELVEENLEAAIADLEKQREELDQAIHHAKTELANASFILFERKTRTDIPTKKLLIEKDDLFLVCNSVRKC